MYHLAWNYLPLSAVSASDGPDSPAQRTVSVIYEQDFGGRAFVLGYPPGLVSQVGLTVRRTDQYELYI
jgi:hypothetical protein